MCVNLLSVLLFSIPCRGTKPCIHLGFEGDDDLFRFGKYRQDFRDIHMQLVRKTSLLQGLDIRTNLQIFDILFDNIL